MHKVGGRLMGWGANGMGILEQSHCENNQFTAVSCAMVASAL